MDIRQYLKSKNITWTEKHTDRGIEALFKCPSCGESDNRFALNLDTGLYNCFHKNKCGISGNFYDFQKLFDDKPQPLNSSKDFKIIKKEPEYKLPKIKLSGLSSKALDFFQNRKIDINILSQFNIGMKNDGVVAFPYYEDGQIVNIKYRRIDKKDFFKEKGGKPVLYNRDMCNDKTIINIMEGEVEVIVAKQYGIDAVSVPSGVSDLSWIDIEFDYLQQFQHIYLMLDMDQAGRDAIKKIADRLGKWRCYNVELPYKDLNDCLINGVSQDEILKCIQNAKSFDDFYLRGAGSYTQEIIDYVKNKNKIYGINTGCYGLNQIIKGWRTNELSIWTGNNHAGKSTMFNLFIENLRKENQKICFATLEMPAKKILRWLLMSSLGADELTDDQIKSQLDYFSNYLWLLDKQGRIEGDYIINNFEYAFRKWGVTHFFIDSLMRIGFDMQYEYAEQFDFCSKLFDLKKSYDIHIHMIAHPRKSNSDYQELDKVDIKGSGHIADLADNVFVVHRTDEKKKEKDRSLPDTTLIVKKNREWGTLGKIEFNFDPVCKKFKEKL